VRKTLGLYAMCGLRFLSPFRRETSIRKDVVIGAENEEDLYAASSIDRRISDAMFEA